MAYDHEADDDDVEEYVEETSERGGGRHRLLIIILSVGCVTLAVSNVIVATRLMQQRHAAIAERAAAPGPTEDPAIAPRTPERSAPAASVPSPSPRAATDGRGRAAGATAEPQAPVPPAATRESPEPAPRPAVTPAEPPERAAPVAIVPQPEGADLPPREAPAADRRLAVGAPPAAPASPTPASGERATAAWMIQEYGRDEAETRARAVADFYGARSSERAYWRRVLAEIVATGR